MPGPFTHIYTARRVVDFLRQAHVTKDFTREVDGRLAEGQTLDPTSLVGLGPTECAALMDRWEKFTALGAIGPDMFFWLQDYNNSKVPDDEIMLAFNILYYLDDQGRLDDPYEGLVNILATISDTWARILHFLLQLNKLWKKFLEIWNATMGPILDAAGKAIDDLTGGLMTALGDALTELKNDVLNLVEQELGTAIDVFSWFSLKMREGFDEQAFVWSDMTHYRRTSVVPAQLIKHGKEMLKSNDALTKQHGEQLLAFAFGWACHVGTDVIGHSFVNEQCGGPFRTHWQRHHLVENHMDAWNYQCTGDGTLPADDFVGWQETYPSIGDAALYFAVQIPQNIDDPPLRDAPPKDKQGDLRKPLPEDTGRASEAEITKLLDTDGALPMWLAEVIAKVLIEVFADPGDGQNNPGEGGDFALQSSLNEGPVLPHPRNLQGQKFQDSLHSSTSVLGKWLETIGVNNAGLALDELRAAVAPDPSPGFPKVPEGFPLPWELQGTYRFMLSWFKRQYRGSLSMDKPEPPEVAPIPDSDLNFDGPPDFSGAGADDNPISDACGAILAIVDWVVKTCEKAAQLLYDIVKSALSALTWPARLAIYYGVTLPAWQAAENMRMVLVHLAYILPDSQQLYDDGALKRPNEIDISLIRLGHSVDSAFQQALASAWDPLGNLDSDPALNAIGLRDPQSASYPWLPVRDTRLASAPDVAASTQPVVEFTRPWAYPDRTNDKNVALAGNYLEQPLTSAGPYPRETMPHQLFATEIPASNAARELYAGARCPGETDKFNKSFLTPNPEVRGAGNNPLGDPVVFSAFFMGQVAHNPKFVSSFNADADRGYGYLCWDWERGDHGTDVDGEGHTFLKPEVAPEGASDWVQPAARPYAFDAPAVMSPPLRLHYPGRKCPDDEGSTVPSDGPPK